MKKVVTTLLLGAASCSAMAVEKQTEAIEEVIVTGQEQQGPYLAGQSSTATKLDLSVMETPQSVTVITRERMDDFGLRNINDVLDNTTGVKVERVETDRTYYTARGFDITNFRVDGLGLPLISGNTHGDLDTAIYERVEVVRGAAGLMSGVGNPSATVNLIRKRPTEDFQASVKGLVGSWDNARVDADVSGSMTDSVRGRVVLAKQDRESYLDRYELEKDVVYGVLEMDVTDTSLLTLGYSMQDSNASGNMWGSLPLYYTDGTQTDFSASTSTSADWSFWDAKNTDIFVEFSQELAERWNLKLAYTRIETEEDSELFYVYGTPDKDTGLGLFGYASAYELERDQDIADIYVNGSFDLGGREHEVVFGYNWSKSEYTDSSLYDYTTGNGFPVMPDLNDWDGNTPRPTFADLPPLTTPEDNGSDAEDKETAFYAAGRFNVLDGLSVITGARLSNWDSSGYSYGGDRESSYNDELVPYLGVVYDIAGKASVYGSYTEIFNPQTETDINRNLLGPVEGESREIGVKSAFFNENLIATFAVFDTKQKNVAVAEGAFLNGDIYYSSADGVESDGYEIELVGEILPGLNTSFGFTQVNIDGDETIEDFTPEKLVRWSTVYNIPSLEALKIGASVNWQDDTSRVQVRDANDNPLVTTKQDSYALIDLLASYQFNEHLNVAMNLKNITDEKYLNSLYWGQSYYGAPRSVEVSATWDF